MSQSKMQTFGPELRTMMIDSPAKDKLSLAGSKKKSI